MTSAELVNHALRACESNKEALAAKLASWRKLNGLEERAMMSRVRAIDRWREPDGPRPDFYATMALLEIAGLLREQPVSQPNEAQFVAALDQMTAGLTRMRELVAHARTVPQPPQPASENGS